MNPFDCESATGEYSNNVPRDPRRFAIGHTYHTADGCVIKSKSEKTVTLYSETGDQCRARYQIADVTRPLNSVSPVCDQGNNVLFTQTGGWIINRAIGRYAWFPRELRVHIYPAWSCHRFHAHLMGTRTVRMLHPDHEDTPCSSEPIDNAGSLSSPEYSPTGRGRRR